MTEERRSDCIMHSQSMASIKDDTNELKKDMKELMILLKGNGKLGFLAKVNILWSAGVGFISLVGVIITGTIVWYIRGVL